MCSFRQNIRLEIKSNADRSPQRRSNSPTDAQSIMLWVEINGIVPIYHFLRELQNDSESEMLQAITCQYSLMDKTIVTPKWWSGRSTTAHMCSICVHTFGALAKVVLLFIATLASEPEHVFLKRALLTFSSISIQLAAISKGVFYSTPDLRGYGDFRCQWIPISSLLTHMV